MVTSKFTNTAVDRTAVREACTPEVASLMARVDSLLADEKAEQGLVAIELSGLRSPWVDNARAVCLLRLSRGAAAADYLRRLVFDSSGLAIRSDGEPLFEANYATALLLDGNPDGFHGLLAGIRDRKHPAVVRLTDSVRRWHAKRSWWEWLKSLLGLSNRPFTLDLPPGSL